MKQHPIQHFQGGGYPLSGFASQKPELSAILLRNLRL